MTSFRSIVKPLLLLLVFNLPGIAVPLTFHTGHAVSASIAVRAGSTMTPLLRASDVSSTQPSLKKMTLSKPLYVVGYSIRTSSAKEMSDPSEIQALWMRSIQQGFFTKDPHRVGHRLAGLYSAYATDGTFTYTLGILADSPDDLPQGAAAHLVKTGVYGVFQSDQGPLTKIMRVVWENASKAIAQDHTVVRSLETDYELFDEDTFVGNHTNVQVYIGLKPVRKKMPE